MSMFTNGVGRPSNETIRKRNIFKGICVLLVIVIIGLVGYILNEKGVINLSNKNTKSGNEKIVITTQKTIKEEIEENPVDAKKIMIDTFGQDYSHLGQQPGSADNYIINYNDDKLKTLSVLRSKDNGIKGNICDYFKCKEYGDLKDEYVIDGKDVVFYKEITVFELKDIEKKFKSKFKTGSVVKTELLDICGEYIYKDNKYYSLDIPICGAGDWASYPINEIYKSYKKGNELFIEMVTSPLKYDSEKNSMYVVLKDKSKIYFDYEDIDKLVKEHGSELTSYVLKFELKDGKYIFAEQDKKIEF